MIGKTSFEKEGTFTIGSPGSSVAIPATVEFGAVQANSIVGKNRMKRSIVWQYYDLGRVRYVIKVEVEIEVSFQASNPLP
jgi:hypothetical protein